MAKQNRRNPAATKPPVTIQQLKRRHRTALEGIRRQHERVVAEATNALEAQLAAEQQAVKAAEAQIEALRAEVLARGRELHEADKLAEARREEMELVTKERDGADVERARAEQAFREAHKEIERLHTELRALKRPPTPHTEGRRDVYTRAVGA